MSDFAFILTIIAFTLLLTFVGLRGALLQWRVEDLQRDLKEVNEDLKEVIEWARAKDKQ